MGKSNETSVWKKEISFRRKPKAEEELRTPEPVAPAEAAPAPTSMWKKEISFRRKPKDETAAAAPTAPTPVSPEPEPEQVGWPEPSHGGDESGFLPPVTAEPYASPASEPAVAPDVEHTAYTLPTAPSAPAAEVAPAATVGDLGEPEHQYTAPPVSGHQPVVPYPPVVEHEAVVPYPPVFEQEAVAPPPPVYGHEAAVPATPVYEHEAVFTPPPVYEPDTVVAPAFEHEAVVTPLPVYEHEAAVPPVLDLPAPEPAPEPAEQAADAGSEEPAEPAPAAKKLSRSERKEQEREAEASGKEHNQLVGLKIGASQIAAAQVINKGGPKVVRMAREPLERGIVVGGELREPEQLASSLKAFFKKHKLPRNCVRLGISNNRIGVRTFELSGITDPKQLANAVRFRAQETLPIPLDEAVLDYRILDDRVGDDGARVCRVLLVVAHKELVERYVSACRKAGLKLVGIDLEAFALLRALSDPSVPPGEDAAVVCVSIGHDRSTLAVSDGRVCEFTRVLAWGGSALDTALARVLDQTPSAVVPIKHALDLAEEGPAAGLDARHADEARRAMVAELQSFARELVASLRFYQEQPNSLGIVEILITGGATACQGLAGELERLLGIPVRVADPLSRVKVTRSAQDEQDVAGSLAIAVGLGIED